MLYALEMFLDRKTEDAVYGLYQRLKEENISTYLLDVNCRPHVSIGVFHDIDVPSCNDRLKDFCMNTSAIPLRFSSVGVFTAPGPCVFLAPIVTQTLLATHQRLMSLFADCDHKGHEYYLPDQWVPHCAVDIAKDIHTICRSTDLLLKEYTPIHGYVEEIGWVEVTKPVKRLETFHLTKE